MAKTTRRLKIDGDSAPAHDMHDAAGLAAVTDSDIARRAYELYEQRDAEHGRGLDDWLLAGGNCRRNSSMIPTQAANLRCISLVSRGQHE